LPFDGYKTCLAWWAETFGLRTDWSNADIHVKPLAADCATLRS
jgi:hypothetical protein